MVLNTPQRLPMAASQSQTSGDGGDCYYLLMRDRERTARMVQQLVDTLQQVSLGYLINLNSFTSSGVSYF